MKDILQKVKRLEVKVRRLVNSTFAGEYRSAFKGTGLEFEEVRAYQVGDDVRFIDWNVSAKMNNLYIKVFREERELNLFVILDVSGSNYFGEGENQKLRIGMEIAAILGYCTLANNDKFGLLACSDQVERYFKPGKGRKRLLSIIDSLVQMSNKSLQTNLRLGLEHFRRAQKRRAVLFVISDFLDQDYENSLRALAPKHDVVLIRLFHPQEALGSFSGIIPIVDLESGATVWVHQTGDLTARQSVEERFRGIHTHLSDLATQCRMGYINLNVTEDYMPLLEKFFVSRIHAQVSH